MKNYKDLLSELPSKSVVFTCGRFNPPNVGHELEIKVVRKLASQRKADHFIFVSSVQDAKKNPLEISKKLQYLGVLFPNTKFVQKEIDAIGSILNKYKKVTLVSSADSVDYYKKALKKIGITDVEVVKAGDTCPDEDDKLIKLASKGEYSSFKGSLPTTVRELDGKRLMNDIRIGLNLEPIKEQINLVKDDLREQYFRGELFNEGDIVESDNTVYKIIKRGSNHLLLQNEAGLKISKWIQDVQLTEREFMLDEKLLQEADSTGATGMLGVDKEAKKAKADTAKMKLALDQAKEKEDLAKQQERERQNLKNLPEAKDSPVVDTSKKYNIAKSIMSLSDFRKSTGQMNADETELHNKVHDGLVGNVHLGNGHGLRHRKVKYHLGEEQIDELSSDLLSRYKKAASDQASAADKAGDFKKGDKRFSGIMKATKKQFDNDLKKEEVEIEEARDDAYTRDYKSSVSGMGKHQSAAYHADGGANDEGWGNERHKPRSTMDRPHTVHINGKPWKKFSNGHQAHAAARTLQAKGKDAHAIAHFNEETDEQQTARTVQLKRFKDQAKDSKLTEAQAAKPKVKTVNVDKVHTAGQEPHEEKFENFKEEFADINEDEFALQVEADMDALTEEDFYEAYDDEELAIIDDETGEEIEAVDSVTEEALMEVLSRIERIRAKARMRRSQTKRERREKVALRQLSTPQVANKRARRMAISAMKKRLLRGQNPQKVSVGQKERVERFIQQRRKIVDRLATRMVSRVKQVEKARMSHKKFTKPNNGVAF
jgi:hypothetical protein